MQSSLYAIQNYFQAEAAPDFTERRLCEANRTAFLAGIAGYYERKAALTPCLSESAMPFSELAGLSDEQLSGIYPALFPYSAMVAWCSACAVLTHTVPGAQVTPGWRVSFGTIRNKSNSSSAYDAKFAVPPLRPLSLEDRNSRLALLASMVRVPVSVVGIPSGVVATNKTKTFTFTFSGLEAAAASGGAFTYSPQLTRTSTQSASTELNVQSLQVGTTRGGMTINWPMVQYSVLGTWDPLENNAHSEDLEPFMHGGGGDYFIESSGRPPSSTEFGTPSVTGGSFSVVNTSRSLDFSNAACTGVYEYPESWRADKCSILPATSYLVEAVVDNLTGGGENVIPVSLQTAVENTAELAGEVWDAALDLRDQSLIGDSPPDESVPNLSGVTLHYYGAVMPGVGGLSPYLRAVWHLENTPYGEEYFFAGWWSDVLEGFTTFSNFTFAYTAAEPSMAVHPEHSRSVGITVDCEGYADWTFSALREDPSANS